VSLNPLESRGQSVTHPMWGYLLLLLVEAGRRRMQPCSRCHSCEVQATADFKGEFLTAGGLLCVPRPETPQQVHNESRFLPSVFTAR